MDHVDGLDVLGDDLAAGLLQLPSELVEAFFDLLETRADRLEAGKAVGLELMSGVKRVYIEWQMDRASLTP